MSAAYSADDRARVDHVAGVDDDVVVDAAPSTRSSSSIAPASCAFGTIELLGAGQDVEARLVLAPSAPQELLVEAVQVLDRVEHA